MAQKPVPRAPGEGLKLVGFKAPLSMDAAIQARADELGLTKSDFLRALVETGLASDPEVAA